MERYSRLAKELGMVDAMIISPKDICFDIRAILKCRWGCEDLPVYDRKKVTKGETPLSSLCQTCPELVEGGRSGGILQEISNS